jgi:hypothetical protein
MWRPRTEEEIQVGIDNGATVESASFDAKVALPAYGKNKDLAKDICAMTVDGGTLLYGVGGADPTRPDKREPFDTRGARERVDSVAQTGIAEPPVTIWLLEQSLTRAVYQPLAVAAWLYNRAGFYGSVDVAAVVMGIEGVGGASGINGFGPFSTYGAAEYRRHERITGEELRSELDRVVIRLLRPLYEVISVPNYDPLAARAQ